MVSHASKVMLTDIHHIFIYIYIYIYIYIIYGVRAGGRGGDRSPRFQSGGLTYASAPHFFSPSVAKKRCKKQAKYPH